VLKVEIWKEKCDNVRSADLKNEDADTSVQECDITDASSSKV